ncbi:MAG: deoxyribodipyrimidine photo-lyase [Lewinellaceae bacterium]|nr:deoxyribodipyrimidine photo-lyase [Lewinellaceae bacterium]HRW75527.1 deoxyribodipyrimidine photo-lyase [Saprospiraceae bacterium]
MTNQGNTLFWFRRDLRVQDNHGLYRALTSGLPVIGCFIFDEHILSSLEDKDDARVTFLHDTIHDLQEQIDARGGTLIVEYGKPEELIPRILDEYHIQKVYFNHDDEPYALQRDQFIAEHCQRHQISLYSFKDHLIFERDEVLKKDGLPYTVFTPYANAWKNRLELAGLDQDGYPLALSAFPSEHPSYPWKKVNSSRIPSLDSMGFVASEKEFPPREVKTSLIRQYGDQRDYPSAQGTSRLGIHFRFGTISIREKARKAYHLSQTFLNELIWRDFYAMILHHFPHVVNGAFRTPYDQIEWRNDEDDFRKWCMGMTGYPLVDAGMRQLNATGFMHNRVRMVVASFLTKHLLINWQWGEAYFARKLLDYDLASNNGGWQWAAGCGTDAAPYFRIFNPDAQQKKFDPKFTYIQSWLPEWGSASYPPPMVDHAFARQRCLKVYQEGLNRSK